MMLIASRRLFVAALLAFFAVASAAQAQTDYYWNPTTGGVGTWDTPSTMWSDNSAVPLNYSWTNSGSERANFGNTGGTVTLGQNITAYGINITSAGYVIAGGGNSLTLSGPGGVINNTVDATISAPIIGSVGLTKTGSGTLTLNAANTYSGNTTVSGGTLLGLVQPGASPFSSGAVTLNGGVFDLKSLSSSATGTTVGNLTVSGTSAATVGTSNLIVENANGAPSTTFAAGNLVHGGVGTALVVTPQSGTLGTTDIVTLTNGNSILTNGILPPWVVTSTGTGPADYVTYSTGAAVQGDYNHDGFVNAADYVAWRSGSSPNPNSLADYNTWRTNFGASGGTGTGVVAFSAYAGNLTTSGNTSVVNQTTSPTITGNVAAYALKTDQAINLSGNTLTLGNGSGQSGLILNNGASITGGNITFGQTEGVVYVNGATPTLGSLGNTITSNGLTINRAGRRQFNHQRQCR